LLARSPAALASKPTIWETSWRVCFQTIPGNVARGSAASLGYFYTASSVLMLCNSFEALSANVAALKTRAMVVHFLPAASEILAKVKTFATDAEIVAFLEQFHEAIDDFSLRTYPILRELKQAGLDWRKYGLDETSIPPKVVEIADLLVRFNIDTSRVREYSGSRRDYYNWKQAAVEYLRRRSISDLKGATAA